MHPVEGVDVVQDALRISNDSRLIEDLVKATSRFNEEWHSCWDESSLILNRNVAYLNKETAEQDVEMESTSFL